MPLPSFLIVGAVKCGTSTLRDYLKQHEEIYIAPSALQFFNKEQNFRRGMKWYERQFRARPHHRAIGEKTPTYCFDKQAPERIAQNLPGVKLIWILRDPVKRAYSNYWHKMRRGGECIEFEAVVEECLKQERAGEPVRSNILERGRYAEQIKRYLEFFPREDMKFLLFEEFFSKPTRSLPGVFEFLGVLGRQPNKASAVMEARLHASQRTAGMAREEIVQEKHRLRVRSQHKPAAAGQLSANVGRDERNASSLLRAPQPGSVEFTRF